MEDFNRATVGVDDLFLCLRPVLITGKILGNLPLQNVCKLSKDRLPKYRVSPWAILCYINIVAHALRGTVVICLAAWFMLHATFGSLTMEEKLHVLFDQTTTAALCDILLCNLIWKTRKLCSLMETWRKLSSRLSLVETDVHLKIKIAITLTATMVSAISENLLNNIRFRWLKEQEINVPFLQGHYKHHHRLYSEFIPYNPVLAAVLLFFDKITVISINYASILHISLSFALAGKFTSLVSNVKKHSCTDWWTVRKDYLILFELVEHVEDFMSFQILCSMCFVLYWICISVYIGIANTSDSFIDGIYGFWAFIHLSFRFLLICIPAGAIPESSYQIWAILQKFPGEKYTLEVIRMEHLISRPIGLTGAKFFILSRSFILGVISVLFTIEIVLLQMSEGRKNS
ncbi:unnamed protein product [Allacma fusca]|uniref:Gustatory receptor n=1 Tax=Allacma fusca TaxID=39272 RepID=A0A8J2L420_9HEXA|nr:unnamed protein product [Allacma fusca]